MILSEKETTVIKDLQTQEQCCVEKYERYSKLAKALWNKETDGSDVSRW